MYCALFLQPPGLLAAYLGIHLAGGVMVPVNAQYPQAELRHIFEARAFACVLPMQGDGQSSSVCAEILPNWR